MLSFSSRRLVDTNHTLTTKIQKLHLTFRLISPRFTCSMMEVLTFNQHLKKRTSLGQSGGTQRDTLNHQNNTFSSIPDTTYLTKHSLQKYQEEIVPAKGKERPCQILICSRFLQITASSLINKIHSYHYFLKHPHLILKASESGSYCFLYSQ